MINGSAFEPPKNCKDTGGISDRIEEDRSERHSRRSLISKGDWSPSIERGTFSRKPEQSQTTKRQRTATNMAMPLQEYLCRTSIIFQTGFCTGGGFGVFRGIFFALFCCFLINFIFSRFFLKARTSHKALSFMEKFLTHAPNSLSCENYHSA